ncbi:MAG: hypothetical protein E4H36_05150 [Spirochaetales bacterium]|nr:MAG: hypothetical protein E4H36_05150 [Spirochaetales bacterium]
MGDIEPRSGLAKHGTTAAAGIAGGIVLLVLGALGPVASLIVGGVIIVVGVVITTSREDRLPGIVAIAAGAVTALGVFKFGFADFLLRISGIGLLIMGGIKLFQFFKGMRNRG